MTTISTTSTTTTPAPAPAAPTATETSTGTSTGTATTGRWKAGLAAAAGAAVVNLVLAAALHGAGVSFQIQGEMIPLLAFAQMTFLLSVVGIVLATALARWARRPQRTFVVTTVVLTALSLVPDVTAQADTATRLALMATHLVAAAIVVPVVARRLPAGR